MTRFFRTSLSVSLALGLSAWAAAWAAPNPGPAAQQKQESGQAKQGQAGQQGSQAAPAGQPNPEEIRALQAIQNELDPDKTIQMVSDFEKKFPGSRGLSFSYLKVAGAYQEKGDLQHSVEYGEKSLKLDQNNPIALVFVASLLPEPKSLEGNELDKEKKLTQAEEYANRALQLAAQFTKQPNMTEEQYQQFKGAISGSAHSSLGMVHMQRSAMALTGVDRAELAKAQAEYKLAVSLSPRPDPYVYYRMGESYAGDGKTGEAIEAFSKASEVGEGTPLKKLADDRVEELKKGKSATKPPAKP